MAVYTQLTHEQIAAHLEQFYQVGVLDSAEGITQGVENTNYRVVTKNAEGAEEKYILTLYEKRVKTQDLPFFLGLLQHVAAHGVACPRPILRRDGNLFGECAGKQASLVSFLNGESHTDINGINIASVGNVLGELHLAAQDFSGTRTNALSLSGWQTLYRKIAGRLNEIEDGLEVLVQDELAFLTQHFDTSELMHGVIHADLFPDNVFFEDDQVSGIIDFYFACTDALAYDVAITLNAWCFDRNGEFNPSKSELLLNAYQRQRSFSYKEMEAFPTLLRGAALRFLLTRAHDRLHHDPAALLRPHDPLEYAAKLRFHQQVKDASDYGFHAYA